MILENMNLDADPCENFYEFTCGGFINKTRLSDTQSTTGTFNKLGYELVEVLTGMF